MHLSALQLEQKLTAGRDWALLLPLQLEGSLKGWAHSWLIESPS
jgi:hypothetical protein